LPSLKEPAYLLKALLKFESMISRKYFALFFLFLSSISLKAQSSRDWLLQLNTITTAVPFLIINPETRGGGMGDVGVATTADAASMHWNVAKYAFAEDKTGISISYTPWLRALVPDISISYISGYHKIDKMSAFAGSLRYFSLGSIQFTDQNGQNTTQYTPNEFAIDAGYSRKLAERLSGGLAGRYVNSNLTGGQIVGGAASKAGQTAAVDLGVYYQNDDAVLFDKDASIAWGLSVTNLGAKISYTNTANRDYLPINLRLGPRVTFHLDDYNDISVALDFNKYLVPTRPEYYQSASGDSIGADGNRVIFSGLDPTRPVAAGVLGSFYDSPGLVNNDDYKNPYVIKGSRLGEELREISFGIGAEYWYDKQFSFRAGYYYEHISKGNRKFATIGAGLRLNVFGIDFSYLVPTYFGKTVTQTSPLSNTVRFTLSFNFAEAAQKNETDKKTE